MKDRSLLPFLGLDVPDRLQGPRQHARHPGDLQITMHQAKPVLPTSVVTQGAKLFNGLLAHSEPHQTGRLPTNERTSLLLSQSRLPPGCGAAHLGEIPGPQPVALNLTMTDSIVLTPK